jgi:RHS repeat-associated protein
MFTTNLPNVAQTLAYDTENQTGGNWYDEQNQPLDRTGVWNEYGLRGERLGTYTYAAGQQTWTPVGNPVVDFFVTTSVVTTQVSRNIYFGGRLIQSNGDTVATDRLGSVRVMQGTTAVEYYPYGEEVTSSANDREKFATYTRESATGLDYANQRYYASVYGRFTSPDPSGTSAVYMPNPRSWNMYAYANSDPVSFNDPTGLDCASTPYYFDGAYEDTIGDIIAKQSDISILATAMYTESGHGNGVDVAHEESSIGATIMNRWEFVNRNWYLSSSAGGPSLNVSGWGTPGDGITSIVENPSQFAIYTKGADGTVSLSASAERNLDNALGSGFNSSACEDLALAITLANGMWSERNDGNPLYLVNGLVLTGFNSFNPAHPSAPYEQNAGSFGDANTFYGVPDTYVTETPVAPVRRRPPVRPVPPPMRRVPGRPL